MTENTTTKPQLVVGIDGSHEARGALDEGLRIAGALGYDVRIICAWAWPASAGIITAAPLTWDPSEDAKAIMANTMSAIEIPAGVGVIADVIQGDAADLLIDASREAKMVITGSTGAGMARALFLGSVSTRVAQRAHCPVLVWRPKTGAVKTGEAPTTAP
ncbi:MAG: universal stress protein [Microbacteriaceae bacterium]|nr:universal stress protein [Microbacteriaceae bacterium]MCL2796274.1 universal stress protein [Microbacteriaceae bacterium]